MHLRFQVGTDSSDSSAIYCDTTFLFDDFSLDMTTVEKSTECIETMDTFLNALSRKRSEIVTYVNRMESAQAVNISRRENLMEAHSIVADVDVSEETQKLVKYQLLRESAVALRSQMIAFNNQIAMNLINSL